MLNPRNAVLVLLTVMVCVSAARAAEDYLDPAGLDAAGLVKFWQLQLPLEPGQQLIDVYLVDDALYVATDDGYVSALDAHTGVLRWLQQVTRSGYRVRRPAHAGENVYFVTPTDIQVYNRRTGDGVRRESLRFPPGTGMVSDGQRLYVGGIDRRLYAFNLRTLYYEWRVIGASALTSTPALFDKWIFFAADNGSVYACTRADKGFLWQGSTYGRVTADLRVDEHGVYVACEDTSLYLLDLNFGQPRWRVRFSAPLYEPPVLATDVAFQYCAVEGLTAIETRQVGIDQRVRWALATGRTALAVDDPYVYVLSRDEQLLAVRLTDGQIDVAVPAAGFLMAQPAVERGTVFLASPDGRMFCARPKGVAPLTAEDITAALRPAEGAAEVATSAPAAVTTQPGGPAQNAQQVKENQPATGGRSKISQGYSGGG